MSTEQVGVDKPYVIVKDDAVRSTFNAVKRRIMDEHGAGEGSSKLIHPALTLFSSEKYMDEFFLISRYMWSPV